jgi:hypothetical protein
LFAKNDHAAAIVYYELLRKQKPGFADGIIELINSYIMTGENDKAKKLIAEYSANKKFDQAKLETIKMLYPGFVSLNLKPCNFILYCLVIFQVIVLKA